jgi:hypothetical protein
MRSRAGAALGFTLVEAAASVALLGGVIVAILVARNNALEAHTEADQILACTRLCAAEVAGLRAGFAGEGTGVLVTPSGKYEWRITASAVPEDAAATVLTAYEVTVRPAPLALEDAGEDSTPAQAVEPPDEQCVASAILWLPAKPAPGGRR